MYYKHVFMLNLHINIKMDIKFLVDTVYIFHIYL